MMFAPSDNPITLLCVLFTLGLLPLAACCLTSYLKLSIVFNIARSGFGVQGIPPAFVTGLLSIALTLQIMAPVASKIAAEVDRTGLIKKLSVVTWAPQSVNRGGNSPVAVHPADEFRRTKKKEARSLRGRKNHPRNSLKVDTTSVPASDASRLPPSERVDPQLEHSLLEAIRECVEPLEDFLKVHASASERRFFRGEDLAGEELVSTDNSENLATLAPAFVVSELGAGFRIGLVLLLPFVVIDLVVANVLVALGLTLVNPVSISLPIKLALFGMTDGWFRICQGLIRTYG